MMNDQTTHPLFAQVFGKTWDSMPIVFKKRYGNVAFKEHTIKVNGEMNIYLSKIFSYLAPLIRLGGFLLPYAGKNIPAIVEFKSKKELPMIFMNRTFYYPQKTYQFNSILLMTKNFEIIELMKFGIGMKMVYRYENSKVEIHHKGYVWRVLGYNIALPLTFLFGKIYGQEVALSEQRFSMVVKLIHPIFGIFFEYNGFFELK